MASAFVLSCLLFSAIVETQAYRTQDDYSNLRSAVNSFDENVLYKKLAKGKNENVVFSPFSIHEAMSMAFIGASGNTAEQMSSVLGFSSNRKLVNNYRSVIDSINSDRDVKVSIANAAYVNPSKRIKPDYLNRVRAIFSGEAKELNFGDSAGPEQRINNFVSRQTNGKISKILDQGSLDIQTEVVLVNAIYFKGKWANPFDRRRTRQTNFMMSSYQSSVVQMMHTSAMLPHKTDWGLSADIVELPFEGDRFAFYIVLPDSVDGINQLEGRLSNSGAIAALFEGLQVTKVDLQVPKFRIRSSFALEQILKADMPLAFDQLNAEFAWISDDDVYISKVAHEAVIEINESGTEASAATAVVITTLSIGHSFVADHPFVFFLRDKVTGQILFQGKFMG